MSGSHEISHGGSCRCQWRESHTCDNHDRYTVSKKSRIPAIPSPPDGLFAFALQVSTLGSNQVTSNSAKTLKRRTTAGPLRIP
ncbi:hypothetical protein P168DRAFT_20111 [Aspergillus campestris IBT 28561]|uniref:Uncharacterized protein n=1 Tax=Aspergillus campestris (strain IBT 28561) TaxID=1392248 RepID=A0A2I1DFH8_ASPC2|nr:uncharacterized protein P168DRAFT_20111 [Aspergillus campestris IBT 28561]PKY08629.1 hypothetical protein P168DRAFT_20111 [Aspergillus campestris IBT 28561]